MVKTKTVCTIGPASSSETILRKMILKGMDIARMNFSHGDHEEHLKRIKLIRELNNKYHKKIKILLDLEGFRIRIGNLQQKEGITVKKNQIVYLTNNSSIPQDYIPFDYEGELRDIIEESLIYIDDGNIALKVIENSKDRLKCETIVPGIIKSHKGINIPDIKLNFTGLTEKDIKDIQFGIKHEVDYFAQSFVRSSADVTAIKDIISPRMPKCGIIAKIENREGIKNIGEIIQAADGIMIARGDMGVSIPIYEIPVVQKQIIRKCNKAHKFVITATQMLESMTEHLRPTRAEVTDVANAVFDGTDMVMLSGETAIGKHPVESV
ncbi:MAG: pyruvate kinase [Spirochaetaceae bacterium]|jgi:pyruvate kinase|nr:pyruvate kinase [Spirochaetaceae bacterium]